MHVNEPWMHSIEPWQGAQYWAIIDVWCQALSYISDAWCTALCHTDAWCTSMSRECTALSHGTRYWAILMQNVKYWGKLNHNYWCMMHSIEPYYLFMIHRHIDACCTPHWCLAALSDWLMHDATILSHMMPDEQQWAILIPYWASIEPLSHIKPY